MGDAGELTNVPDYQKIRQTSQVSGDHSEWSEDVETLTPSPVVRPPKSVSGGLGRPMPQHQYGSYVPGSWSSGDVGRDGSGATGPAMAIPNKASWEAQTSQYSSSPSSRFNSGLMGSSHSMSAIKEQPSYLPQGFSQPVTKYMDTGGVERRVIRRHNASPNRKSYTEGFHLGGDASDVSMYPEGRLSKSVSQRNVNDTRGVDSGYSHSSTHQRSPRGQTVGGSGDDQWKMIGGGHMKSPGLSGQMSNKPQDDLRHWQQQHQEELLHQHLETQALYESPGPPHTAHPHHGGHGGNTSFKQLSIQEEPPARWEPVRRAADNIIREKNMIIDKLKNRILELEEDFRVSESKLREAYMSKEDGADIVQQKLHEAQHKQVNLKEQLSEARRENKSEVDNLELKLGAAEHKISQLEDVLRNKDLGVDNLRQQLENKVREAVAWKEKFEDSCSSHQDMKKKLDSLQRYLDDLPTVDESRLQAQQVHSYREEKLALAAKLDSNDKKLHQLRKVVTARDFRLRELEDQLTDVHHQLDEARQEVDKLRGSEGQEFYNTQRELAQARQDKERLQIDLEKAKKLLETTHLKLRQVEVKFQAEVRAVEERAVREEETVESLRGEVRDREQQVEAMKKSLKEMGHRNQELLEQTLMVKEQVRHMEGSSTEASSVLHRRFMGQLSLCFSELQALVKVCSQRSQGQEPDISVLLTSHTDLDTEDSGSGGAGGGGTSVTQWLAKIGELRREVDKLRSHICNKYAEDMGDNITCATQ